VSEFQVVEDDEFEHDEGEKCISAGCVKHDTHWHDDFAYLNKNRLPVPDDAPTLETVKHLLDHTIQDNGDEPVYRFAVIYVNAQTGTLQVMTNPGMSHPATINLLGRALSIIAFQEAQAEQEAERIVVTGMGDALRRAVQRGGGNDMPDLSAILGGINPTGPRKAEPRKADDKDDMREGYL
jgi:hypothetical protein